MQYILFEDQWLDSLQNWAIRKICKNKKIYDPRFSPHFWTTYKGLKNLSQLNKAIFINCLYTILNKPSYIGYPSTAYTWGPYLNVSPFPPPTSSLPRLRIKKILSKININIWHTEKLKNISLTYPPPLSPLTLNFLSSSHKLPFSNKILSLPPPPPSPALLSPYKVFAFPDGAVNHTNKSMRTAIFSTFPPLASYSKSPSGPLNTMEAELQGIEDAIIIAQNTDSLYIISDSLSSILALQEFPFYSTSKMLKTPNRATLRRILSLLSQINKKLTFSFSPPDTHALPENSIFIGHIHSHLKENLEKRTKFLSPSLEKYGKFTQAFIDGNHKADKIAGSSLHLSSPSTTFVLTPGNDLWQLTDSLTDSPIYEKIRNTILDQLFPFEAEKFPLEAPTFSSRLLDPLVSPSLTTAVFRTHKQKYIILADFMHKLLNKSLPTKKRLINYAEKMLDKEGVHPKKKIKIQNSYGNPFCQYCRSKGKLVIEDTEHIFSSCPHHIQINSHTYQEILKIINKHIPFPINSLPVWFTSDNTQRIPHSTEEYSLMSFPHKLGDTGYIPKDLIAWISTLSPKNKHLPKKITRLVQYGALKKWQNRNNFLFGPPTTLPPPIVPPPSPLLTSITPIPPSLPPKKRRKPNLNTSSTQNYTPLPSPTPQSQYSTPLSFPSSQPINQSSPITFSLSPPPPPN